MAIDSAAKRRSALACHRLPWLRRFTLPAPDASIDQGDRQQVAFIYDGILAGAPTVSTTPVVFLHARGHRSTLLAARGTRRAILAARGSVMAIQTALLSYRGEDITIVVTMDEVVSGWAASWRLKDTEDGTVQVTRSTGSGVTCAGRTITIVVPSASLDLAVGSYHWSLVRTDSGSKALLAYGPYDLLPPRAT